MAGIAPTFYKIPVTKDLVQHVTFGTYPPGSICVTFCLPPVPRPGRLHSEGMEPLDNRYPILSCYEAFAKVLASAT